MFLIRNQQINIFNSIKPAVFESQLEKHIAEHFPQQLSLMGSAGLRKLINKGYKDAGRYKITTSAALCIYIDMMIMLGHAFTTDPQLPWIADIFEEDGRIIATENLHTAYRKTISFFVNTEEKNLLLPYEQWISIMDWSFQKIEQVFKTDFQKSFAGFLEKFWPQKYKGMVKPVQVYDAINEARNIGFTTGVNIAYYCTLRFLLGHNFADDPQYPWIVKALKDDSMNDEIYSVKYLHKMVQHHGAMLTGCKPIENFDDQLN